MTRLGVQPDTRDGAELETLQSVARSLERRGDRPALVGFRRHELETWSFADLARRARRLAFGLQDAGLERGEHAILFAPNVPEWVMACLALFEAAAVPVPVDAQLSDDDLAHVLQDSEARWIFTTHQLADRFDSLRIDGPRRTILLDAPQEDEQSWQHLARDEVRELPIVEPDDIAVLFYTSGTTGVPKGVPLTHRNLTSNVQAVLEQRITRPDDRLLLPLPLHHVYPFTVGMLIPLAEGLTIIFPYSLTGPQVLRALNEGEATVVIGVPRLYTALYNGIEAKIAQQGRMAESLFYAAMETSTSLRRRVGILAGHWMFGPLHRRFGPRLRLVVSGGSALSPDVAYHLEGLGWEVATGYGLTETSPILTFNMPGHGRLDSAGRPLPGVELRIAEPTEGQQHGEVLARGPNVFGGYRNLPNEDPFTEDGFFKTGDLGYFDDEGYLHLVGRASSLIVLSGGENVRPEDVEEALERAPHIREVGVLERDGKLAALIVPEPAASRDNEQRPLEEIVRQEIGEQSRRLPSHHRIGAYEITSDPLPRTRLGKLRRHLLEERFEQAQQREEGIETGPLPIDRMSGEDRQLLEEPAARKTWDWLAERFPKVRLTPDSSWQHDLDVDSLEWLNLSLELRERVGLDLDEEAIGRMQTVRDLLREAVDGGGEGGPHPLSLDDPEGSLTDDQRRWLEPKNALERGAGALLYGLDQAVLRAVFRLEVEGLEHLPRDGQFVFTPSHASHLDPFALAAALGYDRLRDTYWAGWTGIAFNNWFSRLFSRVSKVVPIDPERGILSSLAFGAALLKRGKSLVWFPEGQRSLDGRLQAFRPGVGMLLHRYPVPVVPVAVDGSHEALPPGRAMPRLVPIRVLIGRPLDPAQLEQQGSGDEPHDRIANALRDEVARLHQSYRYSRRD